MSDYLVKAAATILAVCVLVRLADLVLEPVLPLVVVAAFLAGVGWLVLGGRSDLS